MSKVYIHQIDKPVPHRIGQVLAKTIIGQKKGDEEDSQENTENAEVENAGKNTSSYFEVSGSSFAENYEIPSWQKDLIKSADKEALKKTLIESDFIIYDINHGSVDEARLAIEYLHETKEQYKEKTKVFILISTLMTWAKTKVEAEDPEASLSEEDYRKRRAHPNFKAHLELEKDVTKFGKRGPLKTYVVNCGLVYHGGESLFHLFFKSAWHGSDITCYGEGNNILPTIHLSDLTAIIVELIEFKPETYYIVAVDESKNTLMDIAKAISESMGTGVVKTVSKEDALLVKELSQADFDMLTLNLKIDPAFVKDLSIEWKFETGIVENVQQLIAEYKEQFGLWPVKVFVHGPPYSGLSAYAQRIAKDYKIHYVQVEQVISEAVMNLERVANRPVNPEVAEDEQKEAAKELLEEFKTAVTKNNNSTPLEYVVRFLKERLVSMPCRNQGYVLEGFPNTTEEALQMFQGAIEEEDAKNDFVFADKGPIPEFVIHFECSDEFIKNRAMKQSGENDPKFDEQTVLTKLANYRMQNTDENTLLNFFDEKEIHPLTVQLNDSDNEIQAAIKKFIGKPHNYGPTAEEILQMKKKQEEENIKLQQLLEEEKAKREKEENERYTKSVTEWNLRLEEIRKQEREVLEAQSVPLRQYLMKNVMPTLTTALIDICKVRPEDPIDYLAEFLFKNNSNAS